MRRQRRASLRGCRRVRLAAAARPPGLVIGGLSLGSYLLARAGLLAGWRREPISRARLAAAVGLSSRQLERLFRRYLDRTPTRYYLELRLARARLLLLQTDLSVLEVALACGFVSASHFSKCYRDVYGRTPRDQRQAEG